MKLNIRPLKDNDYDDTLVGWWKDWEWEAPLKSILPNEGTGGLIVYDGDVPVCAGFVYQTNSKMAWVEWVISNKQYKTKPNRKIAIELLVRSLTMVASGAGYEFCYALTNSSALSETYKNIGYTEGDSYSKEMIKIL